LTSFLYDWLSANEAQTAVDDGLTADAHLVRMITEPSPDPLDIPVCCGFPVGSNSCLPLIEGAPCSLDVTTESALLSFDVEGDKRLYDIEKDHPQMMK